MKQQQQARFAHELSSGDFQEALSICDEAMKESGSETLSGLSLATMLVRVEVVRVQREEPVEIQTAFEQTLENVHHRIGECLATLLTPECRPPEILEHAERQLRPLVDTVTLCRMIIDGSWTLPGWNTARMQQLGMTQLLLKRDQQPSTAPEALHKKDHQPVIKNQQPEPKEDDPLEASWDMEESGEHLALSGV